MATQNIIIVDDSDTNTLSYSPSSGWSKSGVQQEYRQSTHYATAQGATVQLEFVGTSVNVIGTLPATTDRQTLTFSVDNETPREYNTPGNLTQPAFHQTFFSQDGLSDADHTLVVNSKTDTKGVGLAFIDYFTYTESSHTNTTDSTTYFVTETDPRIKYSREWAPAGVPEDFGRTMGSNKPGSQVDFTFTGTSISVYGDLDNGTASEMLKASFSIDGANPTETQYPPQSAAVGFNQQLFLMNQLPQKQHTLTIKVESGKSFWLDYILFSPGKQAAGATATPTQSSSSKPVGAIAGGVVGGVVVVIGLIVAGILFWKKKKQPKTKPSLDLMSDNGTEARLNGPPMSTARTDQSFFPGPASPPLTASTHHHAPSEATMLSNPYSTSTATHGTSSEANSYAYGLVPAQAAPPSQNPYVHTDSGVRTYSTANPSASDGDGELRPSQVAALGKGGKPRPPKPREQLPPAYTED